MRVSNRLSLTLAAAVLTFAGLYSAAGAAEPPAKAPATAAPQPRVQAPQRTATQAQPQRRSYRSYSYTPGGQNFNRASRAPTWSRADSKINFRYGYYPY